MKKIKFKEAFEKLETIIKEIENEGLDLDEMIGKYEEGLELVKMCKAKLDEFEIKVKEMRENNQK
jgi:exodeoxyribonuclease VII small subunit